jgi:hypothetical protein
MVSAFVLALLSLLTATFAKLLADEYKAWAPTLVEAILHLAVVILPPAKRERCAEEWRGRVGDVPGDLSKTTMACGFVLAAIRIDGLAVRFSKRAFDIGFALLGIVLFAPLLGVAFILVKLDSRGPALTGERRTPKNGKTYVLYKIRTLEVTDSSKAQVTRIGRVLRAFSVDELPQLFNVLAGHMSFYRRPDEDVAKRKDIISARFRSAEWLVKTIRAWLSK